MEVYKNTGHDNFLLGMQSVPKFVNNRTKKLWVCEFSRVLLTVLFTHSAVCTQTHGSCTGEDSVSEPTQCTWAHEGSFVICTTNCITQHKGWDKSQSLLNMMQDSSHSDFIMRDICAWILTMSVCSPSILLSIFFLAWRLHQKSEGLAWTWGSGEAITPIIRSRSPKEAHSSEGLKAAI